jgi:NADH-quinone oxidoreductase subunit E
LNQLMTQFAKEIRGILAKYPPDHQRSAVMPLLYLAQRQTGYLSRQAIEEIAEILAISPSDVGSISGFYSLYHSKPEGRYHLQVCTDLPCALRGAEEFLQALCQNLGIKVGETTPDGLITIEAVTCLAGCHRAPLLQVQGDGEITYHENQTVESTLALIEELRQHAKEHPMETTGAGENLEEDR